MFSALDQAVSPSFPPTFFRFYYFLFCFFDFLPPRSCDAKRAPSRAPSQEVGAFDLVGCELKSGGWCCVASSEARRGIRRRRQDEYRVSCIMDHGSWIMDGDGDE